MNARAGLALSAWLLAATPFPASGQPASSTASATAPAAEAEAVRAGLQALTRGQTAVTLAVATTPLATLQERINDVHLRMGLMGWTFVSQEFVQGQGEGGILLVSYRR